MRIVIRTPNWLGDLVMVTPFIRVVLEQFPEAQVDLIVRKGLETLPLPLRGEIKVFDRKTESARQFGQKLRSAAYDRFYVLPPSFSSAWMAWSSGVPARIGYRGEGRRWLLTHPIQQRHPLRTQHLVSEYLDLFEQGLTLEDHPPRITPETAWVDQQLSHITPQLPERYAVLAPAAEYGPAKQWPLAHYRSLAQELDLPVIVTGLAQDRVLGEQIGADLPHVRNLCGESNLAELTALLQRADLLVCNDSGAMHLGAALGIPTLGLFGSSSPAWTRPIGPKALHLSLGVECSPCFERTCRFQHYDCLQNLTPVLVKKTVAELRSLSEN